VHGVPSMGFRFFNVFGPRQDPASPYSGVISIFAARIAKGLSLTLHGDGRQTRDFVYVDDVVRHLVAGMGVLHATRRAEVLNVCTGRATSIVELAQTLARLDGRPLALSFGPARAGDIRASLGSPLRATAMLGVQAKTTLETGLRATVKALAEV
jgi:UDP-glucose 4-epimerase